MGNGNEIGKNMTYRLGLIAELFEMDLITPDEAKKAMERVIEKHTKVTGRSGNGNEE